MVGWLVTPALKELMPFHCHVCSFKYNKYTSFFSFVPISSSCLDMEKLLCFGEPPFNNNKLYKGLNAQLPFLQNHFYSTLYLIVMLFVCCLNASLQSFFVILFISSEICINFHNPGSPRLLPFSCLIILIMHGMFTHIWRRQQDHPNPITKLLDNSAHAPKCIGLTF